MCDAACMVRAMYLSASEVAVSIMGRYNKCSTFTFFTRLPDILDCSFGLGLRAPILGKGRQ